MLSNDKQQPQQQQQQQPTEGAREGPAWSPTAKKPRYDASYRAAVHVTTINRDEGGNSNSGSSSNEADVGDVQLDYTVLVDTLKRELMSAFEKVAEQSARRVLDRLVSRKSAGAGALDAATAAANTANTAATPVAAAAGAKIKYNNSAGDDHASVLTRARCCYFKPCFPRPRSRLQ